MKVLSLAILVLTFATTVLAEEAVKVGALFSISGWGAAGGQPDLDGALLAAEQINARGGVRGARLDLIVEDCASDLRATAAAYRKLSQADKVTAIVGPNWDEFTEVAAPVAEETHVPMIAPSGHPEGMFAGRKYVNTLWPSHESITKPLAHFIEKEQLEPLTVLLADNSYYNAIFGALATQLQAAGIKTQDVQRLRPEEKDFRSILAKIKASGSKAVLALLIENQGFGTFLRQAKQARLAARVLAANSAAFDEVVKSEPAIADGLVYYDYAVAGGEEFTRQFRKRFGRDPGFSSAKAYDAVFVMKDAIERCGAVPEKVAACIRQSRVKGASGEIEFDANGVIKDERARTYLVGMQNGERKVLPMN